jgi:serine protease AprX
VYNENFVPNIGNDYFDRYGHGTHVAGIVGGAAIESTGPIYTHTFRGIAPNVLLINLRVLDGNGAGQDSSVIAAIQHAIQLKSTYNIRVINLSLGRPVTGSYTKDPLCQAVEQAWKAGIVVVVAAGNEGRNNSANTSGYATITAPGNDPYVITVGAMKDMGTTNRADDLVASYSSKGPTLIDHLVKPDIVAPGNCIICTHWCPANGLRPVDKPCFCCELRRFLPCRDLNGRWPGNPVPRRTTMVREPGPNRILSIAGLSAGSRVSPVCGALWR